MNPAVVRIVVLGLIALSLIFAMLFGMDTAVGVPLLTTLVGYLIGSADTIVNEVKIPHKE